MEDTQNQTYSFGTWLRRQRKARDWTQGELAQRVGCTLNTIAKIEIDARRPSRALATRLALALELPPAEIAAVVQAARGVLAVDRLPAPNGPASSPTPPAGSPEAPQRHQIRSAVSDFVGQQDALTALLTCLRRTTEGCVAAICGIRGMGGIGKTELAYLAAGHLRDTFPDAQIVVDLRGASSAPLAPSQAVQQVLHALTPNLALPDDLEALQRHYRSVLHGRHVLILADDALDAAQIRSLLPPPGSALLITSRMRFSLPGMTTIDLEVLRADEAVTLLHDLCPRLGHTEAQRIAHMCGYLPLALRASGGILQNTPALSAARYIQQLADERQRLALLCDPDDPHLDVAVSLALSYAQLDPATQMVFRQLGVIVANFATPLAQLVVALDTEEQLTDVLHRLLRRNLIMYDVVRERWRLHDLVRNLARQQLEAAGEAEATMWRYARAVVQMAQEIQDQYLAGAETALLALAQFDAGRAHIDAAYHWAQDHAQTPEGDQLLLAVALAIRYIGYIHHDPRHESIPLWEQVRMAAQRLDNRREEGYALSHLGLAYYSLGEPSKAINYFEQALAINRAIGDRRGQAVALGNLGNTYMDLGEASKAISYYEQHIAIARELGERRSEGLTFTNLGLAYADLGEPSKAIRYCEQALVIARERGDRLHECNALLHLGNAYRELDDTQRAIDTCEAALTITRAIGDQRLEGYALYYLARAQAQQGDRVQATTTFTQALKRLQEVGDRWGAAQCQWFFGLALAQQDERDQALPLLRAAVAYQQEIGYTKAEEHMALLARLEAGAKILPELCPQRNQRAIGDNPEVAMEDNTLP